MSKQATMAEQLAELARLKAENEALKAKAAKAAQIRMKVSEKGGLSVYGMGRFPVTLYRGQWERLFTVIDDIKAFIAANESTLKVKE